MMNGRNREASGLVRTGRLFGGLINDIKRKTPHYLSDFKVKNLSLIGSDVSGPELRPLYKFPYVYRIYSLHRTD